ncbi:MAG: DUF799 family lipoprotein [Elusimicrobia bacterium]|nr:DUF799 family lipoprotein [Elusimicrobiota bacterium]
MIRLRRRALQPAQILASSVSIIYPKLSKWCGRVAPVLGFFALGACQQVVKRTTPNIQVPEPLAVLPLANETNSLDGAVLVRRLCQQEMEHRGFQMMDLGVVDANLREAGVTEGGQLGALTPQAIGQANEAQGLLYGTLLEFEDWTLGYYSWRKVRARFRLVAAATGHTLWENEDDYTERAIALSADEAKKRAAEWLGRSVGEKIIQRHMALESQRMLVRVFRTFPRKNQH